LKQLLILLVNILVKPFIRRYISKPTHYRYMGIDLVVLPGVFHPRFFFGSKILLRHLSGLDLRQRSFLELGAGSGLISLFAARQGAEVVACDISHTAVENVKQNQQRNQLSFPVLHSDLFSHIPPQQFDIIAINPPYYKKDPVSEADHAWYCGKNSEYFTRLFSSLPQFIRPESKVVMVLSDVCDIPLISSLAQQQGFVLTPMSEHKLVLETNFIFYIQALRSGTDVKSI
jgi:release factor glutamine methyltransferase